MTLFEVFDVDRSKVESALLAEWGLALDEELKASQNRTFAAHDPATGAKYAVRVAPPCQLQRIQDELFFVHSIATEFGLKGICGPVLPRAAVASAAEGGDRRAAVLAEGLVLSVCTWAEGAPVDFAAYKWLTDPGFIRSWGAWLARMHAAARAFAAAHPAEAGLIRQWDEMHGGIMRGAPLWPAASSDPGRYQLLHGDCNISNFFAAPVPTAEASFGGEVALSVFDFDQAQWGWAEWDMAQCMLTSFMLEEAGAVIVGTPVPEASSARFVEHFVAGYESVSGEGSVDRGRLRSMVVLRKLFYKRFCVQAQKEGNVPAGMAAFIDYCVKWTAGLEELKGLE